MPRTARAIPASRIFGLAALLSAAAVTAGCTDPAFGVALEQELQRMRVFLGAA